MKRRNLWLIIGVLVLGAVIGVYLFYMPPADQIIKIGAILPLTGPTSDVGEWQRKGIEVALSAVNEAGGINGKKLKLLLEDSKGQAKEGVTVFSKLTDVEKCPVVFSSLSSISNAIVPLMSKAQVPVMLIAVSFPGITQKSGWVFRDHPGSEDEALEMVDFMFQDMNLRKVVALYCNDDFGIGSYEAFKGKFEKSGGKILWSDSYALDQTVFRDMVTKAKNLKPEGIYAIGYIKATVLLIKQLRESGYGGFVAAPMAMSIPNFIQLGGEALEGAYFTSTTFNVSSGDSVVKEFVERFRKVNNDNPSVFAGFAYDGLMMIAQAMKSKGVGPSEIREGLMRLREYRGAMGTLTISENRNILFPLKIVRLESAKLVPVNRQR